MTYDEAFYRDIEGGSRRSAQEVIPVLLKLIQPSCVVDVGCGVGAWLSVVKEHGIEDVLGVDGKWVNRAMLKIPGTQFLEMDLTRPIRLLRRFDLVMSLEVAEHLPSACADTFIDSLVNLGAVVLFSAAVPFQGGTHHINEQWPDYWVQRFERRGYVSIDCIRPHIWNNERVDWWYAQNILLFASRDGLRRYLRLQEQAESVGIPLPLVHPKKYLAMVSSAVVNPSGTWKQARSCWGRGWEQLHENQQPAARRHFWEGICWQPLFWKNWVYWLAACLPRSIIQIIRRTGLR